MSKVIEKFDIKTFLKDVNLEEDQKPRTLQEIHAEVGFPFTARAVILESLNNTSEVHILPIGTELSLIDIVRNGEVIEINGSVFRNSANRPFFKTLEIFTIEDRERNVVRSDIPRWILLGHK